MSRNSGFGLLVGLALSYVWTPLSIFGVLAVAFVPILLFAFVPASGPILTVVGIAAVACALGTSAALSVRHAIRLQRVQEENILLRASLGRRAIVLAWTACLTAASVGAGLVVLVIAILSKLLAE
jgi:hypothetical protein